MARWMPALALALVLAAGCGRAPAPVAPNPQTGEQQPATPGTTPGASAPTPQRPPESEAAAFVAEFLKARMSGETARVGQMVAPELSGKVRVSTADAPITGYMYEPLGNSDATGFPFRLTMAFGGKQPGSEVAVENILVTWQGGLKVQQLAGSVSESLALTVGKDGKLYLNHGQSTDLVADLAGLPKMFSPYGAQQGIEFGVGKDGWAVGALSLRGNQVLWVTRGLHPLVGISQVIHPGPPVVAPLDLMFEAGGVDAAWAPGEPRYVALTVAMPSGNTDLFVWDVQTKQRQALELYKLIGMDYAVRRIRWPSDTAVAFDVRQNGKETGPWLYDAVNKKLTRP